jgi:hypothetical protein
MSRPSAKLFMSFGVAFLSIAFSKTYVDKKKTRPAKDPPFMLFSDFHVVSRLGRRRPCLLQLQFAV